MNRRIMENKTYKNLIQESVTIEQLNSIKEDFLLECNKREKRISVSQLLSNVQDFGSAKAMFESLTPSLLSKREGKGLINKYLSIIKENKSLKTIYAYIEGLKENETSDSKKAYITEAIAIGQPVNYNEYVQGVGLLVNLIGEAFNVLGDDFVLSNVSYDKTSSLIGESLLYLSTTKKTVKNLNEYFSHINTVSEIITESKVNEINIDNTLDVVVSEITQKSNAAIDSIFETEDKEEAFREAKKICLEMISLQKKSNDDSEIVTKLTEMEDRLNKKTYKFDSFTKDMLYMTELQEVLK